MKKFFKSTIVRIILVFLIIIVIGFVWLFSQMPKMGPKRIQLTENAVGVVSGNSYVWIIRTPHGAILVDTWHVSPHRRHYKSHNIVDKQ